MRYKKTIYDYADEISLYTVEEVLRWNFLKIAHYSTQDVWFMNIGDTIKEIRSVLVFIENCLNDNLENPILRSHTSREYTTEALELRNEIVRLKQKYFDYLCNESDQDTNKKE
jgi:hypothetical protein